MTDAYDHILYEGKLFDIPMKENIIIEKSIAFFSDPEPCFIHRNAVLSRLYIEMMELFLGREDKKIEIKSLKKEEQVIVEYIAIEGIAFIQVVE